MSENKIGEIQHISIENELKSAYLGYSISAIIRALPDIRDGLKPVQRRTLYAMHTLNNVFSSPHMKSARVVGDVIGKYHPHGDSATYQALVRMTQSFSLRYVLVDGQGNFGSIDGDAPAAYRYTEVRMSKITSTILKDIAKDTVDFVPNYDNSEMQPTVLPTQIPNLLVNGSTGIAVGLATNIPPHNLADIMKAVIAVIDDPDVSIETLVDIVKGPDFPTGGFINGRAGIVQAYKTGRGKIYMKARATIEQNQKQESIVVTEIPFMLNKSRLLDKIGWLIKEKKIDGISTFRDESDREGMRVVIEVKRGDNAEVILNKLYAMTQLQSVFGINMVVLDQGQPRCVGLKPILESFVEHRRDVVRRRTQFDLNKAKAKAHLLEGIAVALANIDEIVAIIRGSKTPSDAKAALISKDWAIGRFEFPYDDQEIRAVMKVDTSYGLSDDGKTYRLSPQQAQAILDMRLHRLTSLEHDKVILEYKELIQLISELLAILNRYSRLMEVIREESQDIIDRFQDERRTEIIDAKVDIEDLDLIPDEPVVVTISSQGYTKIQALDAYKAQRRGGVGKSSSVIKEEDYVKYLYIATRHDYLLCFSNLGRLYWLRVYQLPMVSRNSKGRPIINYLPLQEGESITAVLPIEAFDQDHTVVMATKKGVIKRVALTDFSRPRQSGIIAINLDEADSLIGVSVTLEEDVMLFSQDGKVIRFSNEDVRVMGRGARGVRGIRLKEGDHLVSMVVADPNKQIMTVSSAGFGKKTHMDEFRRTGRGGQGIISMQLPEGVTIVSASTVSDSEDVFLITNGGTLVRIEAKEISTIGRSTKGVRLLKLKKSESLVAAQVFSEDVEAGEEE